MFGKPRVTEKSLGNHKVSSIWWFGGCGPPFVSCKKRIPALQSEQQHSNRHSSLRSRHCNEVPPHWHWMLSTLGRAPLFFFEDKYFKPPIPQFAKVSWSRFLSSQKVRVDSYLIKRSAQLLLTTKFSYQSCHGSSVEAGAKQVSRKGWRVSAYIGASKAWDTIK